MAKSRAYLAVIAAVAVAWLGLPGAPEAGEYRRHRGGGERWSSGVDHRSGTWVRVTTFQASPRARGHARHRHDRHRHDHRCAPSHGHGHRGRPGHGSWAGPTWVAAPAPGYPLGGREFLGNVIGGAVGAVVGSQIGRGSGQTAAIVGGTVLGVLVGGSVGRSMDAVDHLYLGRTLESTPTRVSSTWVNPDSRARYEVTPLATHDLGDGRYCREYTATAWIAGERQQVYGTACRQPDGTWEIAR